MKIIGKIPPNTIFLVEFSTNEFTSIRKCTDSNHYLQDAEKIKLKKGEVLTMKIISYHGVSYICKTKPE